MAKGMRLSLKDGAYNEAYRAASEELMTYYDSLSLTKVADEIADIAGKSAQVYYWVKEK